jgi:cell division protein FtsI (penicillin-binding protein 3)
VAEQLSSAWRSTLKRRLGVAAAGFLVWSIAIEARLIYFQVFEHEALVAAADRQQSRTISAPAKRGEILDRNGRLLAYSVDADTVYAVPSEIENPERAAVALCGALGDCSRKDRDALLERLRSRRFFVYVERQISPEQARRIAALDLEGVGFMKENRRYYPNKELAAHLLGYVGLDSDGLGGIEATYDRLIAGEPGKVLVQTDARRHAFSRVERPPTTGSSLELTVDHYLQHIVERELRAGVEWSGATAGSAVIMDPRSGEILAMASVPTFNPNAYREFDEERRRNRAIQDLYEPGSTFKIVTASAALEEKTASPEDLVDVSAGQIRFGSRVIHDVHSYGVLSFEDVIVKSSNVGAIKIGLKLGPETMSAYVRRFGFGRPISPDFRGESPGIVWSPASLTDSALASVSMGYQVGVTPLQMAAAVSSVANGGELVEPRLVRSVIRNGVRLPVPRKVLGRTISAATAKQLTTIMEAVVERGTGERAQLEGYTVAGKTGTAAKVVNGAYSRSDYNVSFVGFVPSRAPVFAIVVVIDSPRKVSPYGGTVAAPVFQKIADVALRHYGVAPSINPPPPVLVARRDEAQDQGTSRVVESPELVPVANVADAPETVFPDLVGLSARDAVRVLAKMGVSARLRGAGVVVDQRPAPGSPVEVTGVATLRLERQVPMQALNATGP